MGVDTCVFISLAGTTISEKFFEDIDACFREISCAVTSGLMFWISDPVTEWYESSRSDVLHRVTRKNDAIWWEYGSTENGDSFPVQVRCSGEMLAGEIRIDSTTDAFQVEYTSQQRAYALKLQRVAELLHARFRATETKAVVDFQDDPWFHFSKDTWEPIDRLPLERDHYPFQLIFGRPLLPDEVLYRTLDECLDDCGYAPWRAKIEDRSSNMSRIGWRQRLQAHAEGRRLFLIYRHKQSTGGFVDLFIPFDRDTKGVGGISLHIYLSPEELSQSQIEDALDTLSDGLRRTFGGKYWNERESRYIWSTV
jgi:hypothetical protein